MNTVFRKLQFKDQDPILVARAPAEFQEHLEEIKGITTIAARPTGARRYPFVLYFVRNCSDIAKLASVAVALLENDGLLWFAYPKKSSKRYDSDIGRDDSWQPLGDLGFEGVRMIAIDTDWSALRLRHVDHIRSMKRDPKRAMSAKGKLRAGR
ncbi:MAG: hypothetical protein OES47_13830 [Acidobacteriota bacterium]|nr:hypothetical protein [Acidobacteriota bacterium]